MEKSQNLLLFPFAFQILTYTVLPYHTYRFTKKNIHLSKTDTDGAILILRHEKSGNIGEPGSWKILQIAEDLKRNIK